MKKIISVVLLLTICFSFTACGDKNNTADSASDNPNPNFGITAADYVDLFNGICPDGFETITTMDASEKIDEYSNYAMHAFDDYTMFYAVTEPETNMMQSASIWILPDGLSQESCLYKFGGYTKVLLASFLSNEDELKQAMQELKLEDGVPYGYQNVYENSNIIAYYSYTDAGWRLMVMPIAAKYEGDDLLPTAPAEAYEQKAANSSSTAQDNTSSDENSDN